jgi:hypothetical protein
MKRTVKPLYGMKGYPNQARMDTFKADLFEYGVDVPIMVDTINENTSGAGVTIDGVLLKDGTITLTAPIIQSVAPAITAHAGGTKAAAYALTEETNVVTVCATALDSLLLPVAVVGLAIKVINLGVATCAIYGAGTNTIDDIVTTDPFILQPEAVVTFNCYTTSKWQSNAEAEGVYDKIYVDTIAENTSATGVTIDSVLLKDGVGTFTAGTAGTGVTITADATVANAKYGVVISKDLQRTAAGAVAQTNEAISVLSDNDSLTGATGAMTIANTVIYFAESNTTVVAQSDVYSGYLMVATYSATTATSGTATNSATGFLLDYNITESAGTLSNTSFNVMMIDFDSTGTPAFANGTYNMLLIDVDTAASLDASATAILNGVYVDMSGTTVTDAQLSLFGLNVLMPTFGTSAQIGLRVSDGTRIADFVNGTNAASLTGNILLTGTGVTAGHLVEFNGAALTTGSIFDYVGVTTKTSGYLFNGSMTTSTLDASTLVDDFSCSCASDGLAADTLRAFRRTWTGAMPNGTAAVDFKLMELVWSSVYGTAATKGGSPTMLTLDCDATINDSTANFYGLDVDLSGMTLTSATNIYGIRITTKTAVDACIYANDATTVTYIGDGTYSVYATGPITVGSSSSRISIAGTDSQYLAYTTSSTATAAVVSSLTINQVMTGASTVNMVEVGQFILTSAVEMGVWANAIVGKIDLSTTGYSFGLTGVICGELDMPSTNPVGGNGQYSILELELGMPNAFTSTVETEFIRMAVWGIGGATGVDTFEHNGYILRLTGFAIDNAHVLHTNTHAPTHGLRCKIDGAVYDLLLSTAVTP